MMNAEEKQLLYNDIRAVLETLDWTNKRMHIVQSRKIPQGWDRLLNLSTQSFEDEFVPRFQRELNLDVWKRIYDKGFGRSSKEAIIVSLEVRKRRKPIK